MKDNAYNLCYYKCILSVILILSPVFSFAFQKQIVVSTESIELSLSEDIIRYEYEFSGTLKVDLLDLEFQDIYSADYSVIEGAVDAYMVSGKSEIKNPKYGVFGINNSKEASLYFENRAKSNSKLVISVTKKKIEQLTAKMMAVLAVDHDPTPSVLVEDVFIGGDCYDVSGVSYTGHNRSKGTFSNGQTNIGISDGVILGSGYITNAIGPNTISNATTQLFTGGDSDLAILANSAPVYDASIIEFDFVPTTDTIRFNYVFASEEYCDYSNSNYNDVFGFFLSGPGISGTFSNGAINIATLPSGQYVTINNVNHVNNPQYYVSNTTDATNTGLRCIGNPLGTDPGISELQYDAYTVELEATAVVQPCQTYHIKLAVADVYDRKFDSAVFLKSNSFLSGEQVIATVENEDTGDQSAFEGCEVALYEFCRTEGADVTEDFEVIYSLNPSSTATAGVDFEAFPLSVTIPAGETCISFPIQLLDDAIVEGTETIILDFDQSCSCTLDALEFEIKDKTVLNVVVNNEEICPGSSATLTADALGGTIDYSYLWSTGESTKSITVNPTVPTSYIVTVTDACGATEQKEALVTIADLPEASLSGSGSICSDQSNTVDLTIEFTGVGPWTLVYTKDGVEQAPISTSNSAHSISINQAGLYSLASVVEQGKNCLGAVSGSVLVGETSIDLDLQSSNPSCFGSNSGTIQVSVAGGAAPYSYEWSDPTVSGNAPINLAAGSYEVTITDEDGCQEVSSEILVEPEDINVGVSNVIGIDCNNEFGTALVNASGGANPVFDYSWSTGTQGPDLSVSVPGSYQVTITDGNLCTKEETVVIVIDTASVVDVSIDSYSINCNNPIVQFNGLDTNNPSNLSFEWTTVDGNISSGSTDMNPTVDAGGIYSLEVFNALNGCTQNADVIVLADFDEPIADAGDNQDLNCVVSMINLDASGSDSGAGFSFEWTTTDGNILSGSSDINPLVDEPGTYTLEVSNLNSGCSSSSIVSVLEDLVSPDFTLDALIDTLTCSNTDTDISLLLNGDLSDHSMVWTDGNNNPILSNSNTGLVTVNSPGVYSLELTDSSNGCSAIEQIEIGVDTIIPTSIASASENLNCINFGVLIDGIGSSAGSMFEYAWEDPSGLLIPGETSLSLQADEAGLYTLTVVNASNGCFETATALVIIDTLLPSLSLDVNAELNCDVSEVLVESQLSDVDNPSFEWFNPQGVPLDINDNFVLADNAGSYTLIVTNLDNGCSSSSSVNVEEDIQVPEVIVEPTVDLNCLLISQSIAAENTALDPIFNYEWTTNNGNILSGATGLNPVVNAAGLYVLETENISNGCVGIVSVEVEEDIVAPNVMIAQANVLTCTNTSIQLDAAGSSTGINYVYNWTTDSGSIISGENSLNPLVDMIGAYSLTIINTDNGCESLESVSVEEDVELPVPVISNSSVLNCVVHSIQLSGETSVGNDLVYEWIDPLTNEVLSNIEVLDVSEAGFYVLNVFDNANGCEDQIQAEIEQDLVEPTANVSISNLLTCADSEATIQSEIFTNSGNYAINWTTTDGQIVSPVDSESLLVESVGTYLIEVQDLENGCLTEVPVFVGEDITEPIINSFDPSDLNCIVDQVSLDVNVENWTLDYTSNWTTLDGLIVGDAEQLNIDVSAVGTYILEVLDSSNGCLNSVEIVVESDYEVPESAVYASGELDCLTHSVELNGTSSSSNSTMSYSWKDAASVLIPGENSSTLEVAETGLFTFVVTDNTNGCLSESTVLVEIDTLAPILSIEADGPLNCMNSSILVEGNSSNVDQPEYKWFGPQGLIEGENDSFINVDEPGFYTMVLANDVNGCVSTKTILIEQDLAFPLAEVNEPSMLTCSELVTTLSVAGSGLGVDFAYLWSSVDVTINGPNDLSELEVSESGVYVLELINLVNGCSSETEVILESNTELPALTFNNQNTINCIAEEVQILGSFDNPLAQYNLEWIDPNGQAMNYNGIDPLVTVPGEYMLLATDLENGCASEYLVDIEIDIEQPQGNLEGQDILTCELTEITLNADNSSGNMLAYEWWDAEASVLLAESVSSITLSEAGNYSLILVDQLNGCSDVVDFSIDQNIMIPQVEAEIPEVLTCIVGAVDLEMEITSSNTFLDNSWYFEGNLVQQGSATSLTVTEPGVYELEVQDQTNGCVNSTSFTVLENIDAPEIYVGTPEVLNCDREEVLINVELNGVPADNYNAVWSTTTGLILSDNDILEVTVGAAGTYELIVVNTANLCTTSTIVDVQEDVQDPIVDAGIDFVFPCFEDEVSLNAFVQSASGQYISEWTTIDGSILEGLNSLAPSVAEPGVYTISVIDPSNGCISFDEVRIQEELPFEIDVLEEQPLCFGGYGAINVSEIEPANGPFVYSINGGDSFGPESEFQYLSPGEYSVVVQDFNGCWSKTSQVEIGNPVQLTLETDVDVFIEQGETYQLNATVNYSFDEISSIVWSPAEGLDCVNCLDPVFEGSVSTSYEVEVTTVNGCVERSMVTIFVDQTPKVFIPNIFTPDGEGSNDIFMITADPETVELVKNFEIYDRWGEKMLCFEYFQPNDPSYGWDGVFNGRICDPGVFIYFAEIIMKDGRIEKFKGDLTISK